MDGVVPFGRSWLVVSAHISINGNAHYDEQGSIVKNIAVYSNFTDQCYHDLIRYGEAGIVSKRVAWTTKR
jgi:hypothetical protein